MSLSLLSVAIFAAFGLGLAVWAFLNTLELQQQRELEDERQENRIRAVRKCLTSGTPMDTIYYLCEELGIKYEQVVS